MMTLMIHSFEIEDVLDDFALSSSGSDDEDSGNAKNNSPHSPN